MRNDPIVEEVRRVRRELANRHGNDLRAICNELRRRESETEREIRVPEPNLVAPDGTTSSAE